MRAAVVCSVEASCFWEKPHQRQALPARGRAEINAEGKREVGNRIAVVEADQPSSSASCGVGLAVGLKVLPLKNSDVFGESMRLRNWQFVFA